MYTEKKLQGRQFCTILRNQKDIASNLGIENGFKKGSNSLFVLVIPGKYRGTGSHLFLPKFTNSSFTKYDFLYNNTQRHLSHQSSNIHNTILYIRMLWSAIVKGKSVEKSVLVRCQLQLIPNRKELYSFSPLLPRRVLERSLCSQVAVRGFVDSKSRFRVQLDIL
jgi:hypothetical protein